MDLNNSILEDIREGVGLTRESDDFDADLIMHINSAIGELNQNGVGNNVMVRDVSTIWEDLQDPSQGEANKYFQMIPLFITLSTKLIFDPPPPSTVEQYSRNIDKILWRLKLAYEGLYNKEVISNE